MHLSFYQNLHRFNDGFALSRLLRDRGRSRQVVSKGITRSMQRRLSQLEAGNFQLPAAGNPELPAISLTSWKLRFDSLPLVLLSLLAQDLLPSRIIVWLADEDYDLFDPTLRRLFESSIVEFRRTQDFGTHKKWLPLVRESNAPFVICDDDIFHASNWYSTLVEADTHQSCVAHRCHRFQLSKEGNILPYEEWDKDIFSASGPSHYLFGVACGGVLIHPERIAPKFRDWNAISQACPNSDDIWLKLAHLDSGVPYEKTAYMTPCIEYLDSQAVGLIQTNVNLNGNDTQIKTSIEDMGLDLQLLAS